MSKTQSSAVSRRKLLQLTAAGVVAAPLAAVADRNSIHAQSTPEPRIRRVVLAPRYGGDASNDWYPTAISGLKTLGIATEVVPLLPTPTAPGIDATVAAIARAVGDDARETGSTLLIGHSVGSRAMLAYLDRHGANRKFAGLVSVAGWFTIDALGDYPVLKPWVNLQLDFAAIAPSAGPIHAYISDNDPFTADWRATADDWLRQLGAAVHIAHGAGHYMTTYAKPVLESVANMLHRP